MNNLQPEPHSITPADPATAPKLAVLCTLAGSPLNIQRLMTLSLLKSSELGLSNSIDCVNCVIPAGLIDCVSNFMAIAVCRELVSSFYENERKHSEAVGFHPRLGHFASLSR